MAAKIGSATYGAISNAGMSQREIGAATNVDHKTVGNDLREQSGENSPPTPEDPDDDGGEDEDQELTQRGKARSSLRTSG